MIHRLRWALLCVAASFGPFCAPASADQTVVIGPGDSVDSLARRFHVHVRDIERANGITKETLLRDGRKLTIPSPPKQIVRAAASRQPAKITGDRIAIRFGPSEGYRRVTLLDAGADVFLTGKSGDWYQVEVSPGQSGWVKSDFVATGDARKVAAILEARRVQRNRARTARNDDDDEKPARRVRHKSRSRDDDEPSPRHRRLRSARNYNSNYRRRHSGRPEADAPKADDDVVRTAYAYRGTPYHYGGSSRGGFDCSGFTSYVYNKKGVSLPHSASGQYGHGQKVKSDSMKKGDLVFFSTTRRGISHVGIYVGEGKFVHASSGGGRVRVDSLNSGYYQHRFRGARRVK